MTIFGAVVHSGLALTKTASHLPVQGFQPSRLDSCAVDQSRPCAVPRDRRQARGKPINITVVTIARELAGFIWDISRLAMSLAIPRIKLPAPYA